MPLSVSDTFLEAVNAGLVPGHRLIHKFGSNSDVGTTLEDVWEVGGTIPWLTAAEVLNVVSSDTTNDIAGGTGARTVVISGLNESFNEIEETVALLATPVSTNNLFRRIQTLKVDSAGTYTGANLGIITLTGSSDAHGNILTSEGRSSQTQYTIPAGHTGFILRFGISMDTGKSINVNLHIRPGADIVPAPFKSHVHVHHWDGLDKPINERFLANHRIEEKTDIWFDAVVPLTNASADIDYDILLIDNNYL